MIKIKDGLFLMETNSNHIFVFGSNRRGIHGAGAALYAKQHYGAIKGVFIGRAGDSYAIPTKDEQFRTLSLTTIGNSVNFLGNIVRGKNSARENRSSTMNIPPHIYIITRIGCGLAGYRDEDIAPMFIDYPTSNCLFDLKWERFLGDRYKYFIFSETNNRLVLPKGY